MARTCLLTQGGGSLAATWVLDADSLSLTPSGAPSRSILLREVEGVGGDDTAVELSIGAEKVILSRLGADGSTLRSDLQEAWLSARARALRLAGDGEPFRFPGTVTFPGEAPAPCAGMLTPHAVLVARAGGDVQPIFLADVERIEFDPDRWCVWVVRWDGSRVGFSHLAGRTDEVRLEMEAARGVLTDEAAAALARWLPTVPPGDRSTLAARWLPGRFLPIAALDSLAGGAPDALFASWVSSQPRAAQGAALREWAADGTLFAGYAIDGGEASLWILARRGERFLLESISTEDWATYRFAGGDEIPSLAGNLLCAPQFSREALYLPVGELTGERADYAIAARSLPFLRALRDRFRGRIIHTEQAAWRAALDSD